MESCVWNILDAQNFSETWQISIAHRLIVVSWHILTGEYPPQPGGVSDYTRLVARGLAEAGDVVHVYAPPCDGATPLDVGVEVHRLPDNFGPRSLRVLSAMLKKSARPGRILVQYVPQAFGWRGMNLPFCFWLRAHRHDSIWVMFHEVYFPVSRKQSLTYNALGMVTRLMARLAARAAERIFVSIPAWEDLLRPLAAKQTPVCWLPIPSSIPVIADPAGTAEIRARFTHGNMARIIGHFGTYGKYMTETLMSLLPSLLSGKMERAALLLGRGGEAVRDGLLRQYPDLHGRVHATGAAGATDISLHLQACDVLLQPFVDGVSSRRTSLMAGLAHGLPIVTTTGFLTEALWAESCALRLSEVEDVEGIVSATESLLADEAESARMGRRAMELYRERFDVSHTVSTLRAR